MTSLIMGMVICDDEDEDKICKYDEALDLLKNIHFQSILKEYLNS